MRERNRPLPTHDLTQFVRDRLGIGGKRQEIARFFHGECSPKVLELQKVRGNEGGPGAREELFGDSDRRPHRNGLEKVFRHELGHADAAVRGGISRQVTCVHTDAIDDPHKIRHGRALEMCARRLRGAPRSFRFATVPASSTKSPYLVETWLISFWIIEK